MKIPFRQMQCPNCVNAVGDRPETIRCLRFPEGIPLDRLHPFGFQVTREICPDFALQDSPEARAVLAGMERRLGRRPR